MKPNRRYYLEVALLLLTNGEERLAEVVAYPLRHFVFDFDFALNGNSTSRHRHRFATHMQRLIHMWREQTHTTRTCARVGENALAVLN